MGVFNNFKNKLDFYLHYEDVNKKNKISFISDKYPTKRDILGKTVYTWVLKYLIIYKYTYLIVTINDWYN